jgi:hypothetical protein
MDLIKGAWNGLSQRGRTIVLVTLIAAVGVVVVLTMAWRYDWTPLLQFID